MSEHTAVVSQWLPSFPTELDSASILPYMTMQPLTVRHMSVITTESLTHIHSYPSSNTAILVFSPYPGVLGYLLYEV